MVELKGSLESIGLPAIVQLLDELRRSGTLELTAGDSSAILGFEGGRLVSAVSDRDQGSAALAHIGQVLGWGEFRFVEGVVAGDRTLDLGGAEVRDELARHMGLAAAESAVTPSAERVTPSAERVTPPAERVTPPGEPVTPPAERVTPTGERVTPSAEPVTPTAERVTPSAERVTPTGERVTPTAERVTPTAEPVTPTGERVTPTAERVTPTAERVTPTAERVTPTAERVTPTAERVTPSAERVTPTAERVTPTAESVTMIAASPLASRSIATTCPLLGFADDPSHTYSRPTALHRCFSSTEPGLVSAQEQRELCLSGRYATCPRFDGSAANPPATNGVALHDSPPAASTTHVAAPPDAPTTHVAAPPDAPAASAAAAAQPGPSARPSAPPDPSAQVTAARPSPPPEPAAATQAPTSVSAAPVVRQPRPPTSVSAAPVVRQPRPPTLPPAEPDYPTARRLPKPLLGLLGGLVALGLIAAVVLLGSRFSPTNNAPTAGVSPTTSVSQTPEAAPTPPSPPAASVLVSSPGPVAGPGGRRSILDVNFASDTASAWVETTPFATRGGGAYNLRAAQAGRFVAVRAPADPSPSDVLVSATFHKTAGPPGGGYGIIVREQSTAPLDGANQSFRGYVFEVGDRGEFGIWIRDNDRWIDVVSWTPSPVVRTGTSTNELTLRAVGNQFVFTVNGADVADIRDASLTTGAVGVFAGGDGNEASLDHFAVTALN